jgi:predicted alpha/beta-fold hydrolase
MRSRFGVLLCAVLVVPALAAEENSGKETGQEEDWAVNIPAYKDKYNDGLYSTIVTMLSIGAPEIKEQKKVKLEIEGWKKKFEVRAILQDKPAPLVVVLVGVDGKADTPMGRLLPYWLNHYLHYNVLSFDSTFRPNFEDCSRHGVSGCVPADAQAITQVIDAFLKSKEVQGKVTKIGIAGYSLGALQTVALAQMAVQKKLPFELSGAVAISPPVKLKSTALILDDMYNKDRWKYTMVDMGKVFMTHEPVEAGEKIPFEPDFMRAGIGFLIREEFTEIVDKNDSIFRLNQLPDEQKDPTVNRIEHARAWGFQKFVEVMSFPYWKEKGAYKDVDSFWQASDLLKLMDGAPPYLRVIVAEDDPFNALEDVAELKAKGDPKRLVLIPHGGHMGFIGSAFTFGHLVQMFRFQ